MKQTGIFLILLFALQSCRDAGTIMTVKGPVKAEYLGNTLPHEHVLVDFIGADSVNPSRYNQDSVMIKALPHLIKASFNGFKTLIDCTPNYIGRDPVMLRRISDSTGMHIVTNTGYYGAAGQKYLPLHVYNESPQQLADRWIKEAKEGIDNTGIRPGFLKLGADKAPLTPEQRKIVEAGAITHLSTGLSIAIHTGDGAAAREELSIINGQGVSAEAFIWVHAQNEKDSSEFVDMAKAGVWVEFDGLNDNNVEAYVKYCLWMKDNGVLDKLLISHDAGWYHVGEPSGGDYRGYETLPTKLIPALTKAGFSDQEVDKVFRVNPGKAFTIKVRK
jgi:phosphotriesterase-related protein